MMHDTAGSPNDEPFSSSRAEKRETSTGGAARGSRFALYIALAALVLAAGALSTLTWSGTTATPRTGPYQGQRAPVFNLDDAQGRDFALGGILEKKRLILVFYGTYQ